MRLTMSKRVYPARTPSMVNPVHPGILFEEMIREMDGGRRTIGEIATLLGVTRQTLHRVMAGQTGITADMAVRIGKLCGNGPGIWLRMQVAYDAWSA